MPQTNLFRKEVKEGEIINNRAVTKSQAEKYNSFYERCFNEGDIDEILERGGGVSLQNFKAISKGVVKDAGYYEAMFPQRIPTFVGRDGKVRPSKLSGKLGDIIFSMMPKDDRTKLIRYERYGKTYERGVVRGGKTAIFKEKQYKGGQFLPKAFFWQ